MSSVTEKVVSCTWLREKLETTDMADTVILDVSWSSTEDMEEAYRRCHIPEAQYFNVMDAEHTEVYPRNIPTAEKFQNKVRSAGINQATHVIIYSQSNYCGYFMSGRGWWTFRYFGNSKVSILDGGLAKWQSLGYPTTSVLPSLRKVGDFNVEAVDRIRKTFDDVQLNLKSGTAQVCDSRAPSIYNGESGHIPGAVNIPYWYFIDEQAGTLKAIDDMKKVFESAGVSLERPVISYCNGGMSSASLVLFGELCGIPDVALYQCGYSEWRHLASPDQKEITQKSSS